MEGLQVELFRQILPHLEATDLCRIASVSKQWCYEASAPLLWRDLFLKQYQPISNNDDYFDEEKKFSGLVKTSQVSQIYGDWKRAYICKIHYRTPQNRISCLANCMKFPTFEHPLLCNHEMGPFAYQPMMFEQFATKVTEFSDFSVDLQMDLAVKNFMKRFQEEIGDLSYPGLFKDIRTTLGDDLGRAWMVVDGARVEDLTQMLSKESNAIFTTLMGSFFNLTNVNNFPYLVKVSSCLTFCEHVYDTSGGDWCYIIVEHPLLQSHIDDMWYLNIDPNLYPNKEMKTMAFLRRHLMKFYTWYNDYFRLNKFTSIQMILHTYEQSVRDELFYEISSNGSIKTPILESYVLTNFDNAPFYPEYYRVIRSDFIPTEINLNGKINDSEVLITYVNVMFLRKIDCLLRRTIQIDPDVNITPEIENWIEKAKSYGFEIDQDVAVFCYCHFLVPDLTDMPEIKTILENKDGLEKFELIQAIQNFVLDLVAQQEVEIISYDAPNEGVLGA